MNRAIMRIPILLLALGFGLVQLICGQENHSAFKAQDILQEVDVSGRLIVHIGCGDGRFTAGFGADDAYLIHGLDAEVEQVAEARGYIRSRGLYGKVSVNLFDGGRLPVRVHACQRFALCITTSLRLLHRSQGKGF